MQKSVLLLDDHKLFREGISCLISRDPGLEVVADTADENEAVKIVGSVHPDLVIMEVSLPFLNGVEATRRII